MRLGLVLVMLLGLTGCTFGDSDNADSTTGPGVSIHCGAEGRSLGAAPLGDTTVAVKCPAATP
jgi:hypothetical protein